MNQKLYMNTKDLTKILLCFAVMLVFWFLPPLAPITVVGMRTIGVFIGTVLLLSICDPIWPVFFSFALLSQTGVMSLNEVLAASLGNWITTFIITSFVLTIALNKSGFTTRLTNYYMSRKFVSRGPWVFTFSYLMICFIVGLFMEQLAAVAFFLPLTKKILEELGYDKDDRYSNMLMMGTVFSVNISGAATPISHPLAFIGLGIYEEVVGESANLFAYMMYGIPVALVIFIIMCLFFRYAFKVDLSKFEKFSVKKILEQQQPADLKEKTVATIFFITAFLWISPGIFGLFLPATNPFMAFLNRFPVTFWSLIAVSLLAIIRINDEPLINLKETLDHKLAWSVIIFVSIAILLGSAVSNPAVGLSDFITLYLTPVLNSIPSSAVVLFFAILTVVLTNFASNVTTITVFTGVALTFALSGDTINPVAIVVTTTMCGSLAYIMPSSFATIAVLHSDEYSNSGTIMKFGTVMAIISAFCAAFIGYPLLVSLW